MGIRIKASMEGDKAVVKCLMQHPMETGARKDAKTGQLVPAHYITEVNATINGAPAVNCQMGGGVASNPFFQFNVKGAKSGDKVAINWVDNKGEKDSGEATVG